ncbi:hypothetical protein BDR04DRAFT_1232828 [Suillus decipiens]|nr:hypothetical protein BDR04DRAFT_1232828 [Suillus decipiens]
MTWWTLLHPILVDSLPSVQPGPLSSGLADAAAASANAAKDPVPCQSTSMLIAFGISSSQAAVRSFRVLSTGEEAIEDIPRHLYGRAICVHDLRSDNGQLESLRCEDPGHRHHGHRDDVVYLQQLLRL